MYSKAQLETIKDGLKDYLLFFGYTDHPTESNETAFFQYKREDGSHPFTEEDLASYKGYLKFNEKTMANIQKTSE